MFDYFIIVLLKSSLLNQIIVTKKAVWIKKENSQYFEDFIKKGAESFEIAECRFLC